MSYSSSFAKGQWSEAEASGAISHHCLSDLGSCQAHCLV